MDLANIGEISVPDPDPLGFKIIWSLSCSVAYPFILYWYGSGSSTLTIYRSGSRRANNIQLQLDPDPTAGFYKTQNKFQMIS